jgi:hypothetical protein
MTAWEIDSTLSGLFRFCAQTQGSPAARDNPRLEDETLSVFPERYAYDLQTRRALAMEPSIDGVSAGVMNGVLCLRGIGSSLSSSLGAPGRLAIIWAGMQCRGDFRLAMGRGVDRRWRIRAVRDSARRE